MHGGGHAWQGVCVAGGGGACVASEGACITGGYARQGGGHALHRA